VFAAAAAVVVVVVVVVLLLLLFISLSTQFGNFWIYPRMYAFFFVLLSRLG
jgi:hypothetical protein